VRQRDGERDLAGVQAWHTFFAVRLHMPILSIASLSILIGKPAPCLLPHFREVFFFLPFAHSPMASRRLSSGIAARNRWRRPPGQHFEEGCGCVSFRRQNLLNTHLIE
jgi:hypothetical protein